MYVYYFALISTTENISSSNLMAVKYAILLWYFADTSCLRGSKLNVWSSIEIVM